MLCLLQIQYLHKTEVCFLMKRFNFTYLERWEDINNCSSKDWVWPPTSLQFLFWPAANLSLTPLVWKILREQFLCVNKLP